MKKIQKELKNSKTFIYYHVIEDKDDPEVPNVFMIDVPQEEIRFSHIKQKFPLVGLYYFRFKFQTNNMIIWMDLNNDECKIPLFNNQIVMKVSRLSWNDNLESDKNSLNEKINNNFNEKDIQTKYYSGNTNSSFSQNESEIANKIIKEKIFEKDLLDF